MAEPCSILVQTVQRDLECGGGVWGVGCGQNKKYKRQGTYLTGLFISIHKRRNCDIVAQTGLGGRDQGGDK